MVRTIKKVLFRKVSMAAFPFWDYFDGNISFLGRVLMVKFPF